MRRSTRAAIIAIVTGFIVSAAAMASAFDVGPWSQAIRVESIPGTDPSFNGPALDGCPFISKDGKSFFMVRR